MDCTRKDRWVQVGQMIQTDVAVPVSFSSFLQKYNSMLYRANGRAFLYYFIGLHHVGLGGEVV